MIKETSMNKTKNILVSIVVFIALILSTDFIAISLQPTDTAYATNVFLLIVVQLLAIIVIELGYILKNLKK